MKRFSIFDRMNLGPTINRWYFIVSLGIVGYLFSWFISLYTFQVSILATASVFMMLGFATGKSDSSVSWAKLLLLNLPALVFFYLSYTVDDTFVFMPLSAISFSLIGTTLRSEWWASRDKKLTLLLFTLVLVTILMTTLGLPGLFYDKRVAIVKEHFSTEGITFKDSSTIPIKETLDKVVVLIFVDPSAKHGKDALMEMKVIRHHFRNEEKVCFFRVNRSYSIPPSIGKPLPVIIDSLGLLLTKYRIDSTPSVVVVSKNGNTALVHTGYSIDEDFRHNMQKSISEAIDN